MKRLLKIVVIGGILISLIACGGNEVAANTLEKLQTFTVMEEKDTRYSFEYEDRWTLVYDKENEYVNFKEKAVANCFENFFGTGCFYDGSASDGGFAYDLSDNDIRIYFDLDVEGKYLSIITYDMEERKFRLRANQDDYEASEELLEWIDECDLVSIMEDDIQKFKDKLEENEVSMEAVKKLKYGDIKK